MHEESTFSKYACPKLKLSRLLLDNLFRILVQNLPALESTRSELVLLAGMDSKSSFKRKTLVAELYKTWVSQKGNRAILREMTFANDCVNCCFCAKEEKFCLSFRKNCAKVLWMETLLMTNLNSMEKLKEDDHKTSYVKYKLFKHLALVILGI